MSDEISKAIDRAVDTFFESIPPNVRYYGMGGDVEIPTSAELTLASAFEKLCPRSREDFGMVQKKMNLRQANRMQVFAMRMATFAVRTNAVRIANAAMFGMVIDDDLVDYRETLVALSVIEDCARRLGTDLRSIMQDAIRVASDGRRETINQHLATIPKLRGLEVRGLEAIGDGASLSYRPKQRVG